MPAAPQNDTKNSPADRTVGRRIGLALLGGVFAGLALTPQPAAGEGGGSAQDGVVDVRAVGDSGFIGGNSRFAEAPARWLDQRLAGFARLRSPDINIMNLEGTLTRSCQRFLAKQFSFAVPPSALAAFARAGFNMVALANNHTLDCAEPAPAKELAAAMADAKKQLPAGHALVWHGLAADAGELKKPAVLTMHGVSVGMVSLKAWENGRRAPVANLNNRVGIYRALKSAEVDVRILNLHGGIESSRRPSDEMIDLAREFISRYDGDIVFAHHPHVAQGFELLEKPNGRRGVIFYSLGNFFHNGLSERGDGILARVLVRKNGIDADSISAHLIAQETTDPSVASAAQVRALLPHLRDSSATVALRTLPRGLTRIPFVLSETRDPAPGYRLVPSWPTAKGVRRDEGSRGP